MKDTMIVHEAMLREEIEQNVRIFLDPDHADDHNVSLLLATSGVGNVGLDSPSIRSVFR